MIVLDTNVVSETMKANPEPAVLAWLDQQSADTLYLSSFTLAELRFGIAVLPPGRRRAALTRALEAILPLFHDRVLAFDADAARHHADLALRARVAGQGFPSPDGYIAAIASARGFAVATRDGAPFRAAGLAVIDPWTSVEPGP